jgi:hypothetical protein
MKYYVILLVIIGSAASAQSSSLNLAIPSSPGSYQSDKFRAGDLDCSNAIGSATQLEFGVTGIINKDVNGNMGDVGVYSRITIPLGKRVKSRIDCNRLYELELKKKQLEVMKLEQELQQLKALKFEN